MKELASLELRILNKAASDEIIWHCKHYTGRGVMKFYQSGEEQPIGPSNRLVTTWPGGCSKKGIYRERFGIWVDDRFFKTQSFHENRPCPKKAMFCLGGQHQVLSEGFLPSFLPSFLVAIKSQAKRTSGSGSSNPSLSQLMRRPDAPNWFSSVQGFSGTFTFTLSPFEPRSCAKT